MLKKQRKFLTVSLKRLLSQRHLSPHSIALGFAVGIFIGLTPTLGLQIVISLIVCTQLKANRLAGFLGVFITNPVTFAPIYTFNYGLGKVILSHPTNSGYTSLKNFIDDPTIQNFLSFLKVGGGTLQAFLVGCLVVASVGCVVTYFTTRWIIVRARRHKNQKLKTKRERIASKRKIRKQILNDRINLLPSRAIKYSNQAIKKMEKYLADHRIRFRSIMTFSSLKNEVQTLEWARRNLALGKKVMFPKIISGTQMRPILIEDLKELEPGYKGILEPKGNRYYRGKIDLILVPGVAFDSTLHRIGYGFGFYDRFLARYPRATKIGLFYDFQMVQRIDIEKNDVPLDVIITQQKIYRNNPDQS